LVLGTTEACFRNATGHNVLQKKSGINQRMNRL
jgi:hypothetical protein